MEFSRQEYWSGVPFPLQGDLSDPGMRLLRLLIGRWILYHGFLGGASDKEQTRVQSLGQGNLLEEEMARHCSIHAWKIPWAEDPGRPQPMGLQGGRRD